VLISMNSALILVGIFACFSVTAMFFFYWICRSFGLCGFVFYWDRWLGRSCDTICV